MKLFVLAAVLCSTFIVAFGAENSTLEQKPVYLNEEEATKFCNSLHPVTEDPRQKLHKIVIDGETIPNPRKFFHTEWCNLHCFLEKVGFFGPDGSMQVRRILKYTIANIPDLAPGSPYLLMRLYIVDRSGKGIDDNCAKAFIQYYRYIESVLTSTLSADMTANPAIKDKISEAIANGNELPKELESGLQKSYKNVELLYKKAIERNTNITNTAAPVPAI